MQIILSLLHTNIYNNIVGFMGMWIKKKLRISFDQNLLGHSLFGSAKRNRASRHRM